MLKILRRLQLPFIYQALTEDLLGGRLVLSKIEPYNLRPGDIATFSYESLLAPSRRILVVATKNGPDGSFISSRGNNLVCGFDLTSREDAPRLSFVLENFYKQRRTTYLALKRFMFVVFGEENFRTFNSDLMRQTYNLDIKQ